MEGKKFANGLEDWVEDCMFFIGKSKGLWFPYQGFSQAPFNILSNHRLLKHIEYTMA